MHALVRGQSLGWVRASSLSPTYRHNASCKSKYVAPCASAIFNLRYNLKLPQVRVVTRPATHSLTRQVVDNALAYQAVVTVHLIRMCTSRETWKLLLMQGAVGQSYCLHEQRIVQCYLPRRAARSISPIFLSQPFVNHKSITPCSAEEMDSENHQEVRPTTVSQKAQKNGGHAPLPDVVKTYDTRGGWTLHRLTSATEFLCIRCNKQKKAKLVATQNSEWDSLCCNGCYGQHLSTAWWGLLLSTAIYMHTSSKESQPLHLRKSFGSILSIHARDIRTCGITHENCWLDRYGGLWWGEVKSKGAINWLMHVNLWQ
jgi:hypothetical protein